MGISQAEARKDLSTMAPNEFQIAVHNVVVAKESSETLRGAPRNVKDRLRLVLAEARRREMPIPQLMEKIEVEQLTAIQHAKSPAAREAARAGREAAALQEEKNRVEALIRPHLESGVRRRVYVLNSYMQPGVPDVVVSLKGMDIAQLSFEALKNLEDALQPLHARVLNTPSAWIAIQSAVENLERVTEPLFQGQRQR